jgi:hypothetical protein
MERTMTLSFVLDLFGCVTGFLAAWFWLRASGRTVRRVSFTEELDASDINRLVTAINRANILNRRAALAATASAISVAVRFLADLLGLA